MATPVKGEEESVNQDTIVILNAGAHWSRHELPMIPHSKDLGDQRLVERAYSRMIDLNAARLSPIARTKIFYRTTSPGHPSCHNQNEPYTSLEAAHAGERNLVDRLIALADDPRITSPDMRQEMLSQRVRWDWDLFVPHNELWKKRITELQQQRAAQQRKADAQEELDRRQKEEQERQMHHHKQHGGHPKTESEPHWVEAEEVNAQWYYLDIWDMSLQRPDAHLKPGKDCLHYCLPSVFNEWIHLFNHDLYLIENGKPATA
ncbi:hypothetical protein K523DRAFT_236055 [Schizophyllum commune Tattone D]|nr:hypothetical protein K523DRAFT_236055 [Schizophyllum commune Tattone D]